MTDEERKALVERLLERRITVDVMPWMRPDALCVEAAAQIEADGKTIALQKTAIQNLTDAGDGLCKRIAELEAALRDVTPTTYFGEDEPTKAYWAKARAALGEK